jgi:hypothetical protein
LDEAYIVARSFLNQNSRSRKDFLVADHHFVNKYMWETSLGEVFKIIKPNLSVDWINQIVSTASFKNQIYSFQSDFINNKKWRCFLALLSRPRLIKVWVRLLLFCISKFSPTDWMSLYFYLKQKNSKQDLQVVSEYVKILTERESCF